MPDFPRVRTEELRGPTKLSWFGTAYPGGVRTPFTGSAITGEDGYGKTMSDYPHPGYRIRVARGEIVAGPMLLQRWERRFEPGHLTNGPYADGYICYGSGDIAAIMEGAFTCSIDSGDLPDMSSVAVTRAFAKMSAAPVMGGEIMSDLGRTISMLRRPLGAARLHAEKIFRRGTRRRMRSAADASKAMANAWLEGSYGWRPLIMDTHEIIKQAIQLHGRLNGVRLVARSEERLDFTKSQDILNKPCPGTYSAWEVSGSARIDLKLRACAGVIYAEKQRLGSAELSRIAGGSSSDLLATAWEIVPYSFVVDQFFNVGNWLQAITPDPYREVLSSWVTTIREEKRVYTGTSLRQWVPASVNPHFEYGEPGSSETNLTTVTRNVNLTVPLSPVRMTRGVGTLNCVNDASLVLNSVIGAVQRCRH